MGHGLAQDWKTCLVVIYDVSASNKKEECYFPFPRRKAPAGALSCWSQEWELEFTEEAGICWWQHEIKGKSKTRSLGVVEEKEMEKSLKAVRWKL